MEIIRIHYNVSKPVEKWSEIKKESDEMRHFIVHGKFKGYYNKAFSLSHCQVSETPFSFFVVSPDVMAEKMFKDDVIINPKIVSALPTKKVESAKVGEFIELPNLVKCEEPCMSFPFRKPKNVVRYNEIEVQYQVVSLIGGLKTVSQTLNGIASEIFQHEYDHCQGKNIYFEREKPVKWWELKGNPKSKGGTSLDAPESLGLERAEERRTEEINDFT